MRARLVMGGVVVVAVAAAVVGFILLKPSNDGAKVAAKSFAAAWGAQKLDTLTYANAKSPDVLTQYKAQVGTLASTPLNVTVLKTKSSSKAATSNLNVDWHFGRGSWTYQTTLQLVKTNGKWLPQWDLTTIQPQLTTTNTIAEIRVQPPRANILGSGGQVLVTPSPVVNVGVSPQRTNDPDGLAKQIAAIVPVDANALAAQIKAAKPTAFVNVITLRQSDYDNLKAKLQPLPGTVFQQSTLPLAPTRQFASALLGRVGPVTADIVKASNGRYVSGDIGGLSGLQQQYDERLAGTAGVTVKLVPNDVNQQSQQLFAVTPVPGQSLTVTLDTKTQEAADDALNGETKPSAMVVMQPSSGNVLAVSNGPDIGGADNALVGQYPPGSAFKVVTTYALLQKGVTVNDNVACPPTINVGGRNFKNAENESFGSAPFNVDFAKSCNTAFISLAPKVPGTTLTDTGTLLGLGAKWNAGVSTFSGTIPAPTTEVDLAATAFGQGKTLVSPLAMANVAADVQSGSTHEPLIVTDPAPAATVAATPLDAPTIATLQSLMRQVVTSGTGTAVNNVKGGDVYGKTGTAEFGTDNPPQTHAWFIGYQGDLAFAVFVDGGGFGGDVAAPIAAKFLNNMAS